MAYYLSSPLPNSDDEIDLLELWRTLIRQWWVIALFTVTGAALAVALVFMSRPLYQAEVVLAPVSEERGAAGLGGQLAGIASLAGINVGQDEVSDSTVSLATLQSRDFTYQFIRDNELLPVLFWELWDPFEFKWKVDEPKDVPTLYDAYQRFARDIRRVEVDSRSGVVTLAIRWHDPQVAARWANELVERVNRHRQQEAIAEAERSIEYLQAQLPETSVTQVQQAIYRLIEAQTKKIMLANVREEYAFKVIDPAVVPDPEAFVWPKPLLFLLVGVGVGGLLGVVAGLIRGARRKRRAAEALAEASG